MDLRWLQDGNELSNDKQANYTAILSNTLDYDQIRQASLSLAC